MKLNYIRSFGIVSAIIGVLSFIFNILKEIKGTAEHYSWPTLTVTFIALALLASAIDNRISKLEDKITKDSKEK